MQILAVGLCHGIARRMNRKDAVESFEVTAYFRRACGLKTNGENCAWSAMLVQVGCQEAMASTANTDAHGSRSSARASQI